LLLEREPLAIRKSPLESEERTTCYWETFLLLEREPLAPRRRTPCFWRENHLLPERLPFVLDTEPLASRKITICFWIENHLLPERAPFASGERTTCYQLKTTCSKKEPHAACSKRLLGLIKKEPYKKVLSQRQEVTKSTPEEELFFILMEKVLCTSERQRFCYL
jgi:hypothetical protein